MEKIDILMATFNGGKFIERQIFSLISQSHKNWRLLVHDDGSNDGTIEIVKRFSELDSRIILIEDGLKYGNAGSNFLSLLNYCTSNFIIFCDQDDIWLDSKLEKLYLLLKSEDSPAAVYSNAYGFDGNGIISEKVSLIERNELSNSLFLNSGVQGCSLMFNRKLLEIVLKKPDYIYMHDHYLTMAAVSFGKLIYLDECLMLYRQHANNVTGNISISFKERLNSFLQRSNPIIDKNHYNANLAFYYFFEPRFTTKQKEIFTSYIVFPNLSFFNKIKSIFKYNFRIGNSKAILILKLFFKNTI